MDEGEGHFVALLRKEGDAPAGAGEQTLPVSAAVRSAAREIWEAVFRIPMPEGPLMQAGELILLLPGGLPLLRGLGVLRAGVFIKRFSFELLLYGSLSQVFFPFGSLSS